MAKIIAPVVTIFNEEEKPDYAGNKKVIDFLIEGGLDGILVLGSAGEFPDLNEQERLDFFRFYAEYVNGRVELLAGTGCIRYADTLALSNAVYELGYTPMVISPYYFEMDQEKLFVYYDRLAKDVKGDLYLYNFPPRTGHSIAPETIRRLIDANPNIIGLKDSVSTPGHTNMVCRAVEGKPFTVYSGFDDQFLSNIANNGGGGCIGALSKPKPDLRKDPFQIGSSLDVVTPEPAEITNYKALDPAGADVVHQPVELRSIKNRSCSSVVHIGIYQIQVGTLCNVGLANLNLICDDIHLFGLAAVFNGKTSIDGC